MSEVATWPDYIAAMADMATRALAGLDDDSSTLQLIETSSDLGPCPASLRPAAIDAAQRLHDVMVAYERRQELIAAELGRLPRTRRSPDRTGEYMDLSA
jgi:hypothetical protein